MNKKLYHLRRVKRTYAGDAFPPEFWWRLSNLNSNMVCDKGLRRLVSLPRGTNSITIELSHEKPLHGEAFKVEGVGICWLQLEGVKSRLSITVGVANRLRNFLLDGEFRPVWISVYYYED